VLNATRPSISSITYAISLALLTVPILLSAPATAQSQPLITPDGTLNAESSQVLEGQNIQGETGTRIQGGATRNSNLFHSFEDFGIGTNQRVYFDSPANIQNIFTRVTGRNASSIDGILGVDGSASLYLLNPNGVIFGPNAQLDVSGAFTATTDSRFVFSQGETYSAVEPDRPPLVTVSIPLGLQAIVAPVAPPPNLADDLIFDCETRGDCGGGDECFYECETPEPDITKEDVETITTQITPPPPTEEVPTAFVIVIDNTFATTCQTDSAETALSEINVLGRGGIPINPTAPISATAIAPSSDWISLNQPPNAPTASTFTGSSLIPTESTFQAAIASSNLSICY